MQLEVIWHGEATETRGLSATMMAMIKALTSQAVGEAHLEVVVEPLAAKARDSLEALLRRAPFATTLTEAEAINVYHLPMGRRFDLLYFVEGECLHAPHAIAEMAVEYQALTAINDEDLILTPYDHLHLYQRLTPSLIVAGRRRYWRTVPFTSQTMLLSQRAFQKRGAFYAGGEFTLTKVDGGDEAPVILDHPLACVAPMPALAVALNASYPPPFSLWQDWLKQGALPLRSSASLRVPG